MPTQTLTVKKRDALEITFANGLCVRMRETPDGGVKIFAETYKGHAVSQMAVLPFSSNSAVIEVRED